MTLARVIVSVTFPATLMMTEDTEMAYRHINKKSMLLYAGVILIAYLVMSFLPVGWATYFIALPAYMICGMTAMARDNNLEDGGLLNDARRLGFAIAAGLMLMFVFEPLWGSFPKWPRMFLVWAISLVWLTSPGMPPWWEWATGAWDHYSLRDKLINLIKSLHGSKKEGAP